MQFNRSFSCLPSSVPVLKLGMSKEEESKTSEVLLGPVLTGSVRKDPIVPTHRDLWSPESHLDSRAQHPQYLLTPSGWMYIGLLFIFTKIKRTFQFRDDNYRKLLKTSTVASSCRNSWRRHYPLGPPPPPRSGKKQLTAKPPIPWKSGLLGQRLKFIMVNYTKSSCFPETESLVSGLKCCSR